jgi:hypothetical protein
MSVKDTLDFGSPNDESFSFATILFRFFAYFIKSTPSAYMQTSFVGFNLQQISDSTPWFVVMFVVKSEKFAQNAGVDFRSE